MTFPLFTGQGTGSPVQVLVGRKSASFNLARFIDWEADGGVRIEECGNPTDDTAQINVRDIYRVIDEIQPEGRVLITQDGIERFRGFIRTLEPAPMSLTTEIALDCVGISSLLDTCIIPPAGGDAYVRRKKESDRQRILWLLKTFGQPFLKDGSSDFSKVQTLETEMESQDFADLTLRQAIEQVLAAASESANYYIDRAGRLHTFDDDHEEVLTAPYEVNTAHTLAANECPVANLRVTYDTNDLINDYYVRGADASGSIRVSDADSIALYGRRSAFIDGPDSDTPRKATRLGRAALRDTKNPLERIRFVVSDDYVANGTNTWLPGQFVRLTAPAYGWTRYRRRVLRVTTTYINPAGLRKMEIEAGALKRVLNVSGTGGLKSYNPARPSPTLRLPTDIGSGGLVIDDSGCCTSPPSGDTLEDFGSDITWDGQPPIEEGDAVSVAWEAWWLGKGQDEILHSGTYLTGNSYDGPGPEWGPVFTLANAGSRVESTAGTANTGWPVTPLNCGVGFGSWSGWRHGELWWKATLNKPTGDLAGLRIAVVVATPDGHPALSTNTVPTGVRMVVSSSAPGDWKTGTHVGTVPVSSTAEVLIPTSLLPPVGGTFWIGAQPAWEADYDFGGGAIPGACSTTPYWPYMTGQFDSGRVSVAVNASATWMMFAYSGPSEFGETDVPTGASWGGPYDWQEGSRTGTPTVTKV